MKTLETVNGKKFWAVDAINRCEGCKLSGDDCENSSCIPHQRLDKRNVIFQPYDEKEEKKTFTRDEVINLLIKYGKDVYRKGVHHERWIEENL